MALLSYRRLVAAELWSAAARSAGHDSQGARLRDLWRLHCTYQAHVHGEDVLIRLYEHAGSGGDVSVELDWRPMRAEAIDLIGRPTGQSASVVGNCIQLTLGPWQIATLKVRVA